MELRVFYSDFINKVLCSSFFFLMTVFSPDYFYVQGYILGQLKLSGVYLATNEIFGAKLRVLVFFS